MRGRHLGAAALVAIGAIAAAACQPVTSPPPAGPSCSAAPGSTIPGQWVATVDPDGPAPTEVVGFTANTPAEKDAEVAELETDGTVLTVEPDRVVTALADSVAPDDDPSYLGGGFPQVVPLTEGGFPDAWTAGFGGSGTTIAILDSGVQAGHEDLGGARVLQGADLVNDPASLAGSTDYARIDPYGHGTHVAGIAAASDNAAGGIGGAPLASILPVRVLNSCGAGSFGDVAEGIQWAAEQGADIISMSLGGAGSCAGAIATAITAARNHGALLVAAAGNSSTSSLGVPAGCDGVVAAGATSNISTSARRAAFSNYGDLVDIVAPGSSILSTYKGATDSYTTLSGTSMATPFVAAAAALVVQHCAGQLPTGQARGDRVAELLESTVGPLVAFNRPQALRVGASGGTYTLTYPSAPPQTTAPIAADANEVAVDAALEQLAAVGPGNVAVVSRTVGAGELRRFEITLGDAAATSTLLTVDVSSATAGVVLSALSGNGSPNNPYRQTASVYAAGGTFTLAFDGQTTPALPFDATAAAVATALEALPTVGVGNVTVTGSSGGPYTIAFRGALAGNNTLLISGDGAALVAGAAAPSLFPGRLDAGAAVAASCV